MMTDLAKDVYCSIYYRYLDGVNHFVRMYVHQTTTPKYYHISSCA